MEKNRQTSVDLSHHLSRVAKARSPSPLKDLQKYFGKEGIISLAGGLPSPEYFPFASITADALVPDAFSWTPDNGSSFAWIWNLFSATKEKTTQVSIPKYSTKPEDLNLATALQYSRASGIPQLQEIVEKFTAQVYKPAYTDFKTFLHTGNTDGWFKTVGTLCNPGEGVLASEWTYPSALAGMRPYGVRPVPVPMDGQGMRADALHKLLSEWDADTRGMPRPHVMYTIPVGQNPTGAVRGRKRSMTYVSSLVNVIIVEDDPYYFLQLGPYATPAERSPASDDDEEYYLSQLVPSYLRFDYEGRVIRLDTFSKTIAPGCRLGWFTCNPVFAERLERQSETSTQAPCGFGQALVTTVLLDWQSSGYIRWLKGMLLLHLSHFSLKMQYKHRRDFFIDCLAEEFHLETEPAIHGIYEGCDVYHVSQRSTVEKPGYLAEKPDPAVLFSFVPPASGMFIWLKINFDNHPALSSVGSEELENKLWVALAEAGVLLGPGNMFSATPVSGNEEGFGHFRVSFSNAKLEDLKRAVSIFAQVLRAFHQMK
ncbi:hypothetical protein K443DRAFT_88812 [Laccaria amethystina LaAM-08-1]|uniref:Aminotransferase class I/classII large domain-containing protein n=1 Tax=Laccaria amethystina LaAM-08-1 TaxID=1095629 RepID=A0A0C9XYH2_9AGAR|nr:hypothetical protein K443DRAFT_88812 [Laccaria amethystina LaAM-08-1]